MDKLFICFHCKNKSPKEKMIQLEVDLPTNPNKPKKQGYRYYHHECFNKKPTYFHIKRIFETDFEKIINYLGDKLETGKMIPFKDVSIFLFYKMPYKVKRQFFDDCLMKYIRKEMKQSVLDYSATGYLQKTLDEYNLTREFYIVDREKGDNIRAYNGVLYSSK